MADQSWISALIEALRGGNNPQKGIDRVMARPSTYNPQSSNVSHDPGLLGGQGMRDPQYADYVRKSGGLAKPYMKWLEEGE